MSEEKKPLTIWDLSFKKKKAPAFATAGDGASSSFAGFGSRKRDSAGIKKEMASDDSDDDMDRIPPGSEDPKLEDPEFEDSKLEEVAERLRKRRAPRPKDPSG